MEVRRLSRIEKMEGERREKKTISPRGGGRESVTEPRELEIESNFLGLALSPPPFSFLQKPTIILSP